MELLPLVRFLLKKKMELLPEKNLKEFLDTKLAQYYGPEFISTDPIQIPHCFQKKEDIEISGFLTATIAWGARNMIIKNAKDLMERMDNAPFDFVVNSEEGDLKKLLGFKHRTFNDDDLLFFVRSLQNIYRNHGGMESVFTSAYQKDKTIKTAIIGFRDVFLEVEHLQRSEKHLANVNKGSAAKRLNMFLRWMVRKDQYGIDFNLWAEIPSSVLMMPLDLHSANVARRLGLLLRKQDDWKAVEELTDNLRAFNAEDPVLYDYALFGLGAFEKFWM